MSHSLSDLSHDELLQMRKALGADQGMLAPFEHRAFAREYAQENPVRAAVALPFLIPGYTAAKALGLTNARSPASMDQLFGGFHGLFEGLRGKARGGMHRMPDGSLMRDSEMRGGMLPIQNLPSQERTNAARRLLDELEWSGSPVPGSRSDVPERDQPYPRIREPNDFRLERMPPDPNDEDISRDPDKAYQRSQRRIWT